MTRNSVAPRPTLPIRSRPSPNDNGQIGATAFANGPGNAFQVMQEIPSSQSNIPIPRNTMYQFGNPSSASTPYGTYPVISPINSAPQPPTYGDGQDDLLNSIISEELADSGIFEGVYPAANLDLSAEIDDLQGFSNPLEHIQPHFLPQNQNEYYQHMHYTFTEYPDPFSYNNDSAYFQRAVSTPSIFGGRSTNFKLDHPSTKTYRNLQPKFRNGPPCAPPDAGDAEETPVGKGRKRGLSPDTKAAARRVRMVGACARCHAKHEKCDDERPCNACKKNMRSLAFPCMSELPKDRHVHLFTPRLYGHLDLKTGFLQMPEIDPDPSNTPFRLRLHQWFDEPELFIPVYRFKPRSVTDTKKSVFPIASTDGKSFEMQPTDILSPRLLPAINETNIVKYTDYFRQTVKRWLDTAEKLEDIGWDKVFFRPEYGKAFPRAVFADICKFYHKVCQAGCPALKNSLKSTVIAYMLGHSFYVPHEDIAEVLKRSRADVEYDGTFRWISPLYVDRFLKALLYQFFKATVRASFQQLQDLCAPNKHSFLARDRIFATSVVLLIVAGSQQSKAIEAAVAKKRRGQDVDRHDVFSQICEIEEWIVDLILELWTYKFSNGPRWTDDEPRDRAPAYRAKGFKLLEKFRESYLAHRDTLEDLPTDLPKTADGINDKTFSATNIDRILKKFFMCCFPDGRQRHTFAMEVMPRTPANQRGGAAKREPLTSPR